MAQPRSVTRTVPMLDFRASFEPTTINAEKRTVDLVWTTGAPVLRGDFWSDPYWEELSLDPAHVRMGRLQSGAAPLLNTHGQYDLSDVIGVVESATLGRKSGTATVRFDSGVDGEEAFRKVREGILRNVSVGYRTYKTQEVAGGDAQVSTFRAVDWEPYEISIVPIGADAGAVTRSGGGMSNPCEFIQERAMDPKDVPTTTTPAPAPTPAPQPSADGNRAAADAERARVLGIQRVGAKLKRAQTEIDAAINGNVSLEAYRAQAVDAYAEAEHIPVQSHVRVEAVPGQDNRDKWFRGATAWIIQRAAQTANLEAYKKTPLARSLGHDTLELDPGEFRGMTLLDLARESLERNGVKTRGMFGQDVVGQAFTSRSAAQSTGDFPILLENVLYKNLLAQYATTPDTWRRFCATGSVTDFRPAKRYRLGTLGSLSALNELGEFTNKVIPDAERQSISASTKGNIIGLSRQAIINDDMGAFSQVATMFGRAAALSIEVDVYALLALNAGLGPNLSDNVKVFDAAHNNITVGAALGSNAIDLDRVAMKKQKDVSGNELLDLVPTVLLVPAELEGQAKQINNGQYDFDALNTKNPWVPNKVAGVFRDIIGTGRLSGTRRYLLADPGIAPTIEVVFVDGQQQPFMDIHQAWRVDGVEWKVRMDYGVNAVDFRGAVTNAGA